MMPYRPAGRAPTADTLRRSYVLQARDTPKVVLQKLYGSTPRSDDLFVAANPQLTFNNVEYLIMAGGGIAQAKGDSSIFTVAPWAPGQVVFY